MASRNQQSHAKRARELAVKEKRERKRAKKAETALRRAEGWVFNDEGELVPGDGVVIDGELEPGEGVERDGELQPGDDLEAETPGQGEGGADVSASPAAAD